MESSWALNNSHLDQLMWRPEVSLLACKMFRAPDTPSLGPAKAPLSRYQQFSSISLHWGTAEILRMVQCRTRAKRSGSKGSPCWTPDADIN